MWRRTREECSSIKEKIATEEVNIRDEPLSDISCVHYSVGFELRLSYSNKQRGMQQ
jgi:hypothetical protein